MDSPGRSVGDLCARWLAAGARPLHVPTLLSRWLAGKPLGDPPRSRAGRFSEALLAALPAIEAGLDALLAEVERHPAADGSCRKLLRLSSGRTVESVDLPRDGLCVSTQVGCAVGCLFCKTGETGLLAQLSSLEILAQVVRARRERSVRRVVFMGMGEPSHNLDAVLDAVAALGTAGRLPHKSLVVSTVGDPPDFARMLARDVRPGLALSLHTLDAGLRGRLLPRAPRVAPDALLDAALEYAERTTYPLLVQWTLLEGVNDSSEEASRLAARLEGRRAIVNYIPFNAVEGSGFRRPPIERCVALVRSLKRAGVRSTLRMSAGQEVEGGCGQLRARSLSESPDGRGPRVVRPGA
jgi:23S rRNA (adenine2503-C2)-methyltransferase